jgi:SAM-dependent methyltransferase
VRHDVLVTVPDDASALHADLTAYYDQDARGRSLRPLSGERSRRREVFVDRLLAGRLTRVLEVGTGTGLDARALTERGLAVRGVDLSPEHVRLARQSGVDAYVAPAQRLPFDDASFDAVWCMSVLMHMPDDDLDRALREMARVVVPGGVGALGLWGGDDVAGAHPDDILEPKRYFSWRSEASVRAAIEPYAVVEAFDTWHVPPDSTYQWVEVRFLG